MLIGAMLEVVSGRHRLAAGHVDTAAEALHSAEVILAQVDSEIGRVVHDLHPPVLDGLGLAAATRDLMERFEAVSAVSCRLVIDGVPRRLPSRAEIALYRMLQEALRNVAVHADATCVEIGITFASADVTVGIRDDGRGFDPVAPQWSPDGGFGLESMRRRVEDLAGVWSVVSRPGLGTRILAWVPLT